ncbi:TetR/AcrR family transcriptional regulator [Egibacter rhizosphaerae]|uniref:TetR/AcrR family transcriptional regulator n=1 Tax=Egibacter rhizosphaerae TaxID=1670831 RepID=A0A411YK90_9ACTN|nr:TetR/AcrR family transcriptional regulator [Egibacter rhizosphaerae]QBI21634.1 TetR/AcrR family transcriptional regulator [Egibacter rhizosphaerae]
MSAAPPASRREQLLQRAAELFRERGYHAVGVDEIAAAAGITGPGLYRHFATKQSLLAALFERAGGQLIQRARRDVAAAPDEATALVALVRAHLDMATRDRALLAVYLHEVRSLAPDDRARLATQRHDYYRVWGEVIGALRPELPDEDVAVVVRALLGLLNTAGEVADDADQAERILGPMARAAALGA